MSKVKKINVRDIDLDLLQNSRIDDVEKEIDKFKMIDKLDLFNHRTHLGYDFHH